MSAEPDNVVTLRQPDNPCVPPHSIETERALLGILMMRPEGVPAVAQVVRPEHFYFADHQEVFACIEALVTAGSPPTPMSIKAYLGRPDIAGRPVMAYLASCCGELINWDAHGHAQIVRDLADRREMVKIGEMLTHRARTADPGTAAQTIIDETEQALLDVRAIVPEAHLAGQTAAQGVAWMLERVRALRSGELVSTAVSSGIPDLDRATNGGFHRGQLYLMAGRPGMGKTVAMTSLSRYAARHAGVLVFQLEVTRDQQWARYLADAAYVHNRPLTFGQIMAGVGLDDEDLWRLEDAEKRLQRLHLRVECEPSISLATLAHKIKIEKKRLAGQDVRLGVVFIDYLKYIHVSDRYAGQRVLEIGEIAGGLKQLAKREDICIVLLAQLNRGVEAKERQDKRPTASDLRDSGELEEAADTIMLLYRDAFYLQKKLRGSSDPDLATRLIEKQNSLEVILGKNRSGPECTLDLWVDVAASSIAQVSRGPV